MLSLRLQSPLSSALTLHQVFGHGKGFPEMLNSSTMIAFRTSRIRGLASVFFLFRVMMFHVFDMLHNFFRFYNDGPAILGIFRPVPKSVVSKSGFRKAGPLLSPSLRL